MDGEGPPTAIAVNLATDELYLTFTGKHQIFVADLKNPTQEPKVLIGQADARDPFNDSEGPATLAFNGPQGLHFSNGILYVADSGGGEIHAIELKGLGTSSVIKFHRFSRKGRFSITASPTGLTTSPTSATKYLLASGNLLSLTGGATVQLRSGVRSHAYDPFSGSLFAVENYGTLYCSHDGSWQSSPGTWSGVVVCPVLRVLVAFDSQNKLYFASLDRVVENRGTDYMWYATDSKPSGPVVCESGRLWGWDSANQRPWTLAIPAPPVPFAPLPPITTTQECLESQVSKTALVCWLGSVEVRAFASLLAIRCPKLCSADAPALKLPLCSSIASRFIDYLSADICDPESLKPIELIDLAVRSSPSHLPSRANAILQFLGYSTGLIGLGNMLLCAIRRLKHEVVLQILVRASELKFAPGQDSCIETLASQKSTLPSSTIFEALKDHMEAMIKLFDELRAAKSSASTPAALNVRDPTFAAAFTTLYNDRDRDYDWTIQVGKDNRTIPAAL